MNGSSPSDAGEKEEDYTDDSTVKSGVDVNLMLVSLLISLAISVIRSFL